MDHEVGLHPQPHRWASPGICSRSKQYRLIKYCPAVYRDTLETLVDASGLHRTWQASPANSADISIRFAEQHFPKRGLRRVKIFEGAANLMSACAGFMNTSALAHTPCQQLDLTQLQPGVVNPVATQLLSTIVQEIGA